MSAPALVPVCIGILVIALVAAVAWLAYRLEQKRQQVWRDWAGARGWSYAPERSRAIAREYAFLDRLRQGGNRYAWDFLRGAAGGRDCTAFSYHYQVQSGKQTVSYRLHVLLLQLERGFPELTLGPESLLERLFQALSNDIDFESVEFSRAFCVRSGDRKLAYDFCNTAMMEYLLAHRDTALELEGDVLALIADGALRLDRIEAELEHLQRIRALMPRYLFEAAAVAGERASSE